MVIVGKFNHVTPFQRHLHAAINAATTVPNLKLALFGLDLACATMDPSRIVDRYLDPWWITPSSDTEFLSLLDGIPDFIAQVRFWLIFNFQALLTIRCRKGMITTMLSLHHLMHDSTAMQSSLICRRSWLCNNSIV